MGKTVVMKPDLIIDCDPGHDDAMAICVAANRGHLLGVTTVAGNVSLEHTTNNALAVVQMLGLDIEVHSGAAGPINGEAGRFASFVHGENGLVGATLPEVTRQVSSTDAAEYILSVTIEHPGAWIVAIGPLTNIATALQREPGLIDRISGISIMGGGTYGNITAASEFNINFDPEAAEIVFKSGARIIQCGLDVTHQLLVTDALVDATLQIGNDFGRLSNGLLAGYLENIRLLTGESLEAVLHDPCAVLAITNPEIFEFADRYVSVETRGEHTRGMTLVDQRSWMRGGPVKWAETIDAVRAIEMVLAAIAAAP
ncbi:MAG: nucleoside hydrolase [Acidimicrobiia bacterium]|nr:nucleoside hydrolase [Acidimicrobiia bacterium]